MSERKYKKGDRVRIKPWEQMVSEFGLLCEEVIDIPWNPSKSEWDTYFEPSDHICTIEIVDNIEKTDAEYLALFYGDDLWISELMILCKIDFTEEEIHEEVEKMEFL